MSAVCPRFWVNCYWTVNFVHSFNHNKKSYADAQETCETAALNGFKTGRLFEPKTQSLNDKVYAESIVVFGDLLRGAWIGIKRKRGHWIYTSSGTKLKFQNWLKKQPRGNERNRCVYSYSRTGQWVQFSCSWKTFFICEFV